MRRTRAEWQAEQDARRARTGEWGFDPGMPWHIANWRERVGIVFFHVFMWCIVAPAIFIIMVLAFGRIMESVTHYNTEHDRCLKNATNGYDIRQCR